MNNKLKSKTRLAAIQLVSQHLINHQDIEYIKDDFDKYYRNTIIDEGSEKIEYNLSFLSKLLSFFKTTDFKTLSKEINLKIKFDRKFEKWDNIIQAIILISISEIKQIDRQQKQKPPEIGRLRAAQRQDDRDRLTDRQHGKDPRAGTEIRQDRGAVVGLGHAPSLWIKAPWRQARPNAGQR